MAGEPYDGTGNRKFLTADERAAFLKAADKAQREVRTFCYVLHFTGCCISEALNLTCDPVDFTNGVLTFGSLKKRRGGVYRSLARLGPTRSRRRRLKARRQILSPGY